MSWSGSFPDGIAGDDIEASLDDSKAFVSPPPDQMSTEMAEQFAAAKEAVKDLIESGAVGDTEKTYSLSLSGHANEGHEPAEGWTNDCINISLSQR